MDFFSKIRPKNGQNFLAMAREALVLSSPKTIYSLHIASGPYRCHRRKKIQFFAQILAFLMQIFMLRIFKMHFCYEFFDRCVGSIPSACVGWGGVDPRPSSMCGTDYS